MDTIPFGDNLETPDEFMVSVTLYKKKSMSNRHKISLSFQLDDPLLLEKIDAVSNLNLIDPSSTKPDNTLYDII